MNQFTSDRSVLILVILMIAFIMLSVVFSDDESQLDAERRYGRMFLPLSYYSHFPTQAPLCQEVQVGRFIYQKCQ